MKLKAIKADPTDKLKSGEIYEVALAFKPNNQNPPMSIIRAIVFNDEHKWVELDPQKFEPIT